MTRALSLACLALFIIAIGGTDASAGKPSIAVLGLEVVDPSGTPTAQDTQVARDLTDGLRARAKAGTGQYQFAPGSDKELIDQKLLNNCDNEAPKCMAAIGNQLGAAFLMYGKIQKEGKSYQVTLKLLDVGRAAMVRTSPEMIPLADTTVAALHGWAKKIYGKLTGESSGGTLIIKLTNAERGTILIEGEQKGTITNGTGSTPTLPEGKVRLGVESEGFRRWEKDVTVTPGSTTIPVELEKAVGECGPDTFPCPGGGPGSGSGGGGGGGGGGPEGGSGTGMWKGVAVAAGVVAVGGAGWWIYNYSELGKIEDEQCRNGGRPGCTATSPTPGFNIDASNKDGDKKSTQTYVGGITAGVAGAIAVFAIYKGFIAKGGSSERQSSKRGRRVPRDRFVVTPIVAPNGGGATLRLDW